MFPYIYLFSKQIPMYGICVLIGGAFAALYLKLTERRFSELRRYNELLGIYAAVGALVGAKLLYLLVVLPEFAAEFQYLFSKTEAFIKKYFLGGFVFYGGLYGALLGMFFYAKKARLSYARVLEYMLPAFIIVHAFGRIGCFCMGCCYGAPTDSAIAVTFANSEIAPNGVPLVPVQLIEAAVELALFALIAVLSRKINGRKMLAIYLGIYAVCRFVLEFWRGDDERGIIGVLSVSQIISIITMIFAVLLFIRGKRKAGGVGVSVPK